MEATANSDVTVFISLSFRYTFFSSTLKSEHLQRARGWNEGVSVGDSG